MAYRSDLSSDDSTVLISVVLLIAHGTVGTVQDPDPWFLSPEDHVVNCSSRTKRVAHSSGTILQVAVAFNAVEKSKESQ